MTRKNILWIMCDQLRFDYLGCAGHPTLHTPNIDALAARGVRFTRAYVQSPVCGPSRMSFYTGRYMRSHGANWNRFPLRVGEPTLGTHLARARRATVLVGKTHMAADAEGWRGSASIPSSASACASRECGFEPFERDDGLHPDAARPRPPTTTSCAHWATSGEARGRTGRIPPRIGWHVAQRLAAAPCRQAGADPGAISETPYMTRRAMAFIDEASRDGAPWCLHLSYIKPHWPYIAPAPYHAMYRPGDVVPA